MNPESYDEETYKGKNMIIGIAGEKKHGKDTVANYLVERYQFNKIAFANKLRKICSNAFPNVDFYDEANKETPFQIPIKNNWQHVDSILAQMEGDYLLTEDQTLRISGAMYIKNTFTSVRDILQFIGTDVLRNLVDPDYHFNSVARVITSTPVNHVISDVRFPNERIGLKNLNALTILVQRPSMERDASSGHASENSLGSPADYDVVIVNDGTLEDLYAKVDGLITWGNSSLLKM